MKNARAKESIMVTRYLDGSEVPPHMRNLKFVPWPLPKLPSLRFTPVRGVNDPATWGKPVQKPKGKRD